MENGLQVQVVGGGIAGLAAALACSQSGANVHLCEQAAAIKEVGAGLQISPNGLAVLSRLGLKDAVADIADRAEAVDLRDYKDGKLVCRLDLKAHASDLDFLLVHRADLVQTLFQACKAQGVRFAFSQSLSSQDLLSGAFRPRGGSEPRGFGDWGGWGALKHANGFAGSICAVFYRAGGVARAGLQ